MILEYDGVTGEQLFEARSVLEVAAVRLAADRATSEVADGPPGGHRDRGARR